MHIPNQEMLVAFVDHLSNLAFWKKHSTYEVHPNPVKNGFCQLSEPHIVWPRINWIKYLINLSEQTNNWRGVKTWQFKKMWIQGYYKQSLDLHTWQRLFSICWPSRYKWWRTGTWFRLLLKFFPNFQHKCTQLPSLTADFLQASRKPSNTQQSHPHLLCS